MFLKNVLHQKGWTRKLGYRGYWMSSNFFPANDLLHYFSYFFLEIIGNQGETFGQFLD
jgi:hypothetical protein